MSDLSRFLSTQNPDWSNSLWDGLIEAINARLAPLEENLGIQREVTDAIIARGLTVIEQELAPIVTQADQILDEATSSIAAKIDRFEEKVTGGTVICVSSSAATLANSATISLTVAPEDREFFAPTPYVAISRATTVANWAIGKVNSFNRETGALSLVLEQVTGAGGPYSDWVITSLPAATLLQKWFHDQTVILRGQALLYKEGAEQARADAVAARNQAIDARGDAVGAKESAEQAYADLRQAVAEPIVPPVAPVIGQLWYDGTVMRVYDGEDFATALTEKAIRVDADQVFSSAERAQGAKNLGLTNSGLFVKVDSRSPVFLKTGLDTLSIKAGTIVEVEGHLVVFEADTAVTMPALAAGNDIAIWVASDGQVSATLNHISPPVPGARKIGGAHYAPGGNAAGFNTGGNSTPQFNEYSLWDEKFRPVCPDPRGMTLVSDSFWVDINLCGVNHHVDGTSKFNVAIADGSTPPKRPVMFGGDGTAAYSTMNWWEAAEVMRSHGKQLLSYDEFAGAAFGAKEAKAAGNDPVSTILRAEYTSKWGVLLATGNMWIWSRDLSYRHDGANPGWAWRNQTGGRGSLYLYNDLGLVAGLLGGDWGSASGAGSRASSWLGYPWNSYGSLGARGRCDHLRHV